MKSNYEKYFLYKMKYLNLRNKMNGGNDIENEDDLLIYNKKITYLPNEYLQNILFIIITNNNLSIDDFYINYVPDPMEHNKSLSKYTNIHIYAIKKISEEEKKLLIEEIDKKFKQYFVN